MSNRCVRTAGAEEIARPRQLIEDFCARPPKLHR